MRARTVLLAAIGSVLAVGLSGTYWIASPPHLPEPLAQPLRPITESALTDATYAKDLLPLESGFRPQVYRSFCGPASIATVLRAYGVHGADQTSIFPSWGRKMKAFYTGMTLSELDALARANGLKTNVVYADQLTVDSFRNRLKAALAHEGSFVLVNYDRRVLKQEGIGHISPVADYDVHEDAFLILDEAAYRYPFTWVPAPLLYAAVHTRSGNQFRGVLFIESFHPIH